jgi:hypothetical protein
MADELIFCAPFRRQYFTEISIKEFKNYQKSGIKSSKFWDEIFDKMIYKDWFYGCYADDLSFTIGYCFSLELNGDSVNEFQKYFKECYKKALKNIDRNKFKKNILYSKEQINHFSGIAMSIFHDRIEMKKKISEKFDINKFTITLKNSTTLGSSEIIDIYTPYYDGEPFDEMDYDDENRDDPIIFSGNKSESLYILDEE